MIKLHPYIVLLSLFVSSVHAAQQRTYPLHEAVQQDDIDRVRQLLHDQRIDINLQDEDGNTALMHAAFQGNKEIVQLLLDNRSDVNLQDNQGFTALMHAAGSNDVEIVQLLLDHGSGVNLQDNRSNTSFIVAIRNNFVKVLQLLIRDRNNAKKNEQNINKAFMQAAQWGATRVLQFLLEVKRVNINYQNNEGDTALIVAAIEGRLETLEALFAHKPNNENQEKVNVNLQNKNQRNALSCLKIDLTKHMYYSSILTYLVKNTQTPSMETDHDLLQEYHLIPLLREIYEDKHNKNLRQYMDILLVNKMLNSIEEDQKKIFYQACYDAYKTDDLNTMEWNRQNAQHHDGYESLHLLTSGYVRNMHPYWSNKIELKNIPPAIIDYMWDVDTYPKFLQLANHTQDRFLFEVAKQAKDYQAVATQNLASSLAKHGIVQDAKEVYNQHLYVIIPLLSAWMKNNK